MINSSFFKKALLSCGSVIALCSAYQLKANAVPSSYYKSNFINLDQEQNQVTSVNELKDVAPSDWAYEALKGLVERYGCIVGYPDKTFRGDRSLTRWEFAAGLNACLNSMERIVQQGYASKADVEALKKLAKDFKTELTALGAKIANLDQRVAFLENHQFSTTTKLTGAAIFSLSAASQPGNQAVLQDRAYMVFTTTFPDQSILITRLNAGNFANFTSTAKLPDFQSGYTSPMTTLGVSTGATTANAEAIDWLVYEGSIPIRNMTLHTYVAAVGGNWNDYVPTLSPNFQDGNDGTASLSSFAQQNPIYSIGGNQGAGLNLELGGSNAIGPSSLTIGYYADNGGSPGTGNGLFNGGSTILGQGIVNITNNLSIGFTYVNSYQPQGEPIFNMGNVQLNGSFLGSKLANGLVDGPNGTLLLDSNKVVNSYGLEAAYLPVKGISLNVFGNYSNVNFVGNPGVTGAGTNGTGQVWSYGAGLAFTDLLKEGAVLGLFGGVQPYFGNVSTNAPDVLANYSTSAPLHLEVFYKYPLSDNILITPGAIWLSNPTQTINGNSQLIGVIRGTLNF